MGHEEYRSMVRILLRWGNFSKEVKRSSMEIVCCALPPIPLPARFFIYNQECHIQGTSNYSNTRENRTCLFKTQRVRSQNTLFDMRRNICLDSFRDTHPIPRCLNLHSTRSQGACSAVYAHGVPHSNYSITCEN